MFSSTTNILFNLMFVYCKISILITLHWLQQHDEEINNTVKHKNIYKAKQNMTL